MKLKNVITMASLLAVGVMSMGSSCQKMAESVGTAITGDSRGGQIAGAGYQGVRKQSIGPAEERAIGESTAMAITTSPGLLNNDLLNDYVTKVGLTVASVAGRDDIEFTFGVINGSTPNAISAPRGYIFITEAALRRMKDESELAGVLGHEISHVIRNHGIDAVKKSGGTDALVEIGVAASGTSESNPLVQAMPKLTELFKNMVYNQSQEREADLDSVRYLRAAGYDPTGLERFIDRELKASGTLFASHPANADRVNALRAATGPNPGGQRLAERFAKYVK